MIGNLAAITGVSARTSTPDSRTQLASGGGSGVPSGKAAATSGETLPVERPPTPPAADVAKAVERLSELMNRRERSLRFEVDASSGRTVITVINDATNEVVRQIPSEELLQLAHSLDALGSLINARV